MTATSTCVSETGALVDVLLKHARDAFVSQAAIAREWRDLHFTAPPDYARAIDEYDAFADILEAAGATVRWLPAVDGVGLDSIYVRDACVMSEQGVVLCRMGKRQRGGEPRAQRDALEAQGVRIAGAIEAPGQIEGGDVVWLDPRTVAVGRGYRTNAEGIARYRRLLGDAIDTLIEVPLPHWRGPGDVFHLMSIFSPVDVDLAVVYSPLMPVPFRDALLERGVSLVEVPDEEFDTMGANVLAVGPRRCVIIDGNPRTRMRLEAAGAEVFVYEGTEISLKGGGGPTCLTRPLERQVES
ncbi:MAG TPA: arginine deiminase family protein [Vicinamibacterales bacterium]|nr:arginine deiminase family protein [Vicinamibacterales bacterium]